MFSVGQEMQARVQRCLSRVSWGLCYMAIVGIIIFLPLTGLTQVLGGS